MTDDEKDMFRKLEYKSHRGDPTALNDCMHRKYNQIKSIIRHLKTPEERWDYICDNTPESSLGFTMCDNLLQWAVNMGIEIKRGDFGKSDWAGAVKQHGDRIIKRDIEPTVMKDRQGTIYQ